MKRKAISKRVRFEVFKRDSFKCQYCGQSSPDVLLHVDHIVAVSNGGLSDVTNYVTACVDCNLGKSNKSLDDTTALKKAKAQLDELNERREQIEMMAQWQKGLVNLDAQAVEAAVSLFNSLVAGVSLSATGIDTIRKYVKRFGLQQTLQGIQKSISHYVRHVDNNKEYRESVLLALDKVAGICVLDQRDKDNPNARDFYYIRAILRNRLNREGSNYCDPDFFDWMETAVGAGVPIYRLKELAKDACTWRGFGLDVDSLIDKYQRPN